MTDILFGIAAFIAIVLFLVGIVVAAKSVLLPNQQVSIAIERGRTLTDKAGRKLMTALTDAGIDLPGTCGGAGTCGLCRVTVRSGAGEPIPAERAKLSRADLHAGLRLACQITLRGDVSIELPASLLKAVSCTATVRSNRTITPLIKELVMELPADCGLEPEPGAFVEVTAPPFRLPFSDITVAPEYHTQWDQLGLSRLSAASTNAVTRAYSVANRPADTGIIVLNVRLALPPPGLDVPPGIVSSWLFGLAPVYKVAIRGPFGNFRVQPTLREMIFIGGGVGMAPLRAMVNDQLDNVGTDRTISYWYGARTKIELIYDDEFTDLAHRHKNFTWTVALSDPRPEDDWQGPTGFIHDVVYDHYLGSHPAPEECEYYLCGPPLMLAAVRMMLDDIGVESESIYFDDFGS